MESITISIEDRGYGIPAADLDKVFKKFFRVTSNQMGTYPAWVWDYMPAHKLSRR